MSSQNQLKVKYSDYGVANFFGNYIEINKKFKYNKPLRDYVVKHELGHKNKFDLSHEFEIDYHIFPLMIFILKNPSTWTDFLPIQFKKKKIIYDLNLMILYVFIISLIVFLIKVI